MTLRVPTAEPGDSVVEVRAAIRRRQDLLSITVYLLIATAMVT